ncbi:MAG: oligosaccharide flippase family protein [Candidatus Auribacterota bacterium]|nr:oligosaccharide flippase family protein [Candidatus Auribacterota bacterium]
MRMGQGTVYLMLAEVMFILSGWAIHVGSKRILGLEDYGTLGILLSLLTLYRIFLATGVNRAVSRYISRDPGQANSVRRQALKLQIALGIGFCIVVWLAAPFLARIWRDDAFIGYIRLTGFFLPVFGIYSVYRGTLNGFTLFGREARVSIIYSLLKVALVFVLIFLFGSWWSGKLYGAVSGYLAAIIGATILARALCPTMKIIEGGDTFPITRIVRFAFPVVLFSFIISLIQHLDLYFVRAMVKEDPGLASGYYTCAQQFARIPYMLLYALSLTIFPKIAAGTASGDNDEIVAGMIGKALRGGLLLVLPIAALIGGGAGPLIGWIYGADSVAGGGALQFLIFGQTLLALLMVLTTIIMAQGRPWVSFLIVVGTLLLDALLNYLLIPIYGINGIIGAAIATTLASAAGMICAGLIVYHRFHVLFPPLSSIKIIIASALVLVCVHLIQPEGWLIPPIYFLLFAGYILLLLLTRDIDKDDWRMLQSLINKRSNRI